MDWKSRSQDIEAERYMLGALILCPDLIPDALERIPAGSTLALQSNSIILEAIRKVYLANQPVDLVTVKASLEQAGLLSPAGGIDYLAGLIELPDGYVTSCPDWIDRIVGAGRLRQVGSLCAEILKQIQEGKRDLKRIFELAEQDLLKALSQGDGSHGAPIMQAMKKAFKDIEDLQDRKRRMSGLTTGFYELDDLLSGLQAGQLYIVGARPSMGKTSLALNILEHVALREGKSVLLFSLEQAAHEISKCLICSHAKVDLNVLKSGRLTEEEYGKLVMAAGTFHEAKIFIDDSYQLSVGEMRSRARQRRRKDNVGLVVVDYLHKMYALDNVWNPEVRQLELAMIASNLKSVARELEVPVIALAQLNRALEARDDPRPQLSDLRQSGTIEEDADVVMMIHREEYYRADTERRGIADIMVLKNRFGPTGIIELGYLRQFMRFENLAAAR